MPKKAAGDWISWRNCKAVRDRLLILQNTGGMYVIVIIGSSLGIENCAEKTVPKKAARGQDSGKEL